MALRISKKKLYPLDGMVYCFPKAHTGTQHYARPSMGPLIAQSEILVSHRQIAELQIE